MLLLLFDYSLKDGSKVFKRHPENRQSNKVLRAFYKKFFWENCYVKDGRSGNLHCIPTCLDKTKWELLQLGGAHAANACLHMQV